ncbi:MAG: radical SAM protein [Phycisphaerales bacterium]|nr:MAG: radical SAM protein [Phycisphaerales bacterium]
MDITAEDKDVNRLTNPAPDDELRAMLQWTKFEHYDSPFFIAWQINSACNLGCLHCCEEAGHSMPDEMTKEESLGFCRQLVDLDIPYVAISGGEPLLCPHIFHVCEIIRDNNISLKMETNGEFIDEEIADKFADLKMLSVQVSIDGASPEAHENLRLRGDWKHAVEACKHLLERDVNTEIVFGPTRFNIHEIGDPVDLACSLGVCGVYTGTTMRIGRAAENWDIICPSDEEYVKFFNVVQEKAIALAKSELLTRTLDAALLQGRLGLYESSRPYREGLFSHEGYYLCAEGKYEGAERALKTAFEHGDRVLGKRHPETLGCIIALAELYQVWNRAGEAEWWWMKWGSSQ